MPSINEFIGPKPTVEQNLNLEKIIGSKPCSKCNANVDEAYWDPTQLIMTWTCPEGHSNTLKVN